MTAWDLLVDARTGVITGTEHYGNPDEWPRDFRLVTGSVADVGFDRPWHADRLSTGTAYGSLERATVSALGEAVERYCGNFVPGGLVRASWRQLTAEGFAAVDPASMCLFSPEQYALPGFPFVPFGRDLQVHWVPGTDLVSGAPVMAPASVVYVNYFHGPRAAEPVTNFVFYAGLAAGQDRRHAEQSAMEELIERDAVELWWDSGRPARTIDVPEPLLARLAACADPVLEYAALLIPGPWRVPVVGVAVHDPVLDIVALGTAARPDPAEALLKAAGEAVSLRSLSKGLLDADAGPWQAAELGLLDAGALKPYRADRRYLDDYAADFHDVTDLLCQSQIHLDPRTRPWTRHLFERHDPVPLADIGPVTVDPWQHYRDELTRIGGHPPVSVDVTTGDVAEAGAAVVRVVAPGVYTNAPAGFAPRDPRRRSNHNLRPLPHT
ncbi:YcaO-like family protein [Nocardioides sp.]|uniref:YcaO-like family protein n=1 Tax=Nocardioides sp. TaxID=35761 RepID=UPI002736162E|nr:YcaO-like family protein [Nocardioides sp.]MDP3890296.1 YcaO-like family protein [Nocardioides sp.]